MDGVNIVGRVVKIVERTEVMTRFGKSQLTVAIISDETGSIRLNLWRWQADIIQVDDIVKIENGFVQSFREHLELNVGSKGKIIVVSRAQH
jgi:replication factor A1